MKEDTHGDEPENHRSSPQLDRATVYRVTAYCFVVLFSTLLLWFTLTALISLISQQDLQLLSVANSRHTQFKTSR